MIEDGEKMFAVGDTVMHSEFGICKVRDIKVISFSWQKPMDFYVLTPLEDDGHGSTFYVAVEQSDCLRKPLTRDQILAMIDAMPEITPLKIETYGNRTQDVESIKETYRTLMNSGNSRDWVILLKTIYQKGQQLSSQRKRLSEFDTLARDIGERMLYGEIAGVMGIPVNQVEHFIARRIGKKE